MRAARTALSLRRVRPGRGGPAGQAIDKDVDEELELGVRVRVAELVGQRDQVRELLGGKAGQ